MGERQLRSRRRSARLLTGTALASVAGAAQARVETVLSAPLSVLPLAVQAGAPETVSQATARTPTSPLASAAGEVDEVLFEADEVRRDVDDGPIIAEGDVRAFFGERTLTADRLLYFPDTDVVVAEGGVAIVDANAETVFADRVELTGDLRDGLAGNFSALLEENARLAADNAVQEQGARTRLTKAVYTSCNVCDRDGDPKVPTWRIKALRVTRDRERRVVRFRHAFIEIKGVPIFYAPYIQGPDPSVERQSGFLTPLVGASRRLGFNVELPYYFAFSNHTDATLSPRYTGDAGTLWNLELRRRNRNGYHVFSGGIVDFDNTVPDENGDIPVDVPGVRWNVFAQGHQNLTPKLQIGYDVERVSDDGFLRNYAILRRGDLRKELDTSNSLRLRTNAYLQYADGGTRLRVDGYLFQGLRPRDDASLTPYVLPQIDFRHQFQQRILGGRADIRANFASLQRTGGADTRRLSASADWEREHITRGGHRFAAFGQLRADGYFYQDLDEGNELSRGRALTPTAAADSTDLVGRFTPTFGAEWAYPLTRRFAGAQVFVEPRVQFVASPTGRNPDTILNEDSQSIEFDYAGIFDFNKATGFDRVEDGQRVNAGVLASAVFDNGLFVDGSIAQQYRFQDTEAFDPATGLGDTRSDYVGALDIRYKNRIGVENRFRFDDEDWSLERAESNAYLNFWRVRLNGYYVRLGAEQAVNDEAREELTTRGRLRLTRNWSTGFSWRQDLEAGETLLQDYVLAYRDECSTLSLIIRRDFTEDEEAGLGTDIAVLVQFTLRSLVD
ncbi:MAG: LPS assembly protein LptD [Pseudomonadota bacterium]